MSNKKRPGRDCNTSGRHESRKGSHENKKNIAQNDRSVKRRKGSARMDQEQLQKPAYWAVLPAAVRYDMQLSDKAKLLYAEISSLTEQRGYCYATNAYFMRLYGISERTLQEHLRSLKRRGYISISDGGGGAGRRKIYAGINPLSGNPAEICGVMPNPAENCGVTPQKSAGGNNNKKDNNSPHNPPGGESEIWDKEAFDRFWAMYPKKKDKAKAIREWNKLKADRKLMREMSAALGAQIASDEWQRDNGRAIPYPCRWLSHRRWEDELDVTIPPVPGSGTSEEGPVWI